MQLFILDFGNVGIGDYFGVLFVSELAFLLFDFPEFFFEFGVFVEEAAGDDFFLSSSLLLLGEEDLFEVFEFVLDAIVGFHKFAIGIFRLIFLPAHELVFLFDLLESQLILGNHALGRTVLTESASPAFVFDRVDLLVDRRQLSAMTDIHLGGFNHILFGQFGNLDWESLVKSLILLTQIDVLSFKLFYFSLDFLDSLVFLVHLYHGFVSNVHSSRCVVESGQRFVVV